MSKIDLGYAITTDPSYLDALNGITSELSSKLEKFYYLSTEGDKSSVQVLLDAIHQYPANPQLKNYLSVLYNKIGDSEKVVSTTQWILSEHPNYLFGKLNLAFEHYYNRDFEKIPELLGEEMDIKALYPERDTFHIDEVVSFLRCAVMYFAATDNLEQAEKRYHIMQEVAPESIHTENVLQHLMIVRMNNASSWYAEEEKNKIKVETKQQEVNSISSVPNFNHEEIDWLYKNGLYIGEKKLNKILSLPKDTLIQDLELVLLDSINRYGYFDKYVDQNDWDEEKMNFVVHAICLLGELKATDSIDVILNVLSQSSDYLELYIGDFMTSVIWEPIFKLRDNNLEVFKQFMFRSGVDTYARGVFLEVVEQVAVMHPERREEAINWYADVIKFFLESKLEENVIDSDLVGFLICSLIDIEGYELLPEIKKLFDKGIVSIGVCGNWEEVKETFENKESYYTKKKVLSIADRYQEITTTYAGYNQEDSTSQFDNQDYFEPKSTPVIAAPKIGRNQSCPCGSGKKYKKCCLNK